MNWTWFTAMQHFEYFAYNDVNTPRKNTFLFGMSSGEHTCYKNRVILYFIDCDIHLMLTIIVNLRQTQWVSIMICYTYIIWTVISSLVNSDVYVIDDDILSYQFCCTHIMTHHIFKERMYTALNRSPVKPHTNVHI